MPITKLLLITLFSTLIMSGCSINPTPPKHVYTDACKLFHFEKEWYHAASKAEKRWGIPKATLLAFVHQESRFTGDAKPKRDYFLGLIPLPRRSSAYGYCQAKDATWSEYKYATGNRFASRDDITDAMDFIGWYNHLSHVRLGISKQDTKRLYLAYHEGRGGYKRRTYLKKPWLMKVANKVAYQAKIYQKQIQRCKIRYRCTDPWPFCR
ncbi:transglycosylase SLT domain-containing protein [Galenea microaerophila]